MNNTTNEPNIKIFVACHKQCEVPQNNIIKPIQVGAKLSAIKFNNMLRDDIGENISHKNDRYCELTAQYWAWKNVDADYYGFFHYRRYMSFSPKKLPKDLYNNVVYENVSKQYIEDFCLDEQSIKSLVSQYDIIVPTRTNLSAISKKQNTIYKHYDTAKYHDIKDYEFCREYVISHEPEYTAAFDEYSNSSKGYFLNMYIMRKQLFFEYCEWLFPILDALDSHKDYTNSSTGELRTVGFVAERLFGVWLTHKLTIKPQLRVYKAQVSFVKNTQPTELLPAFSANNVSICLGADNNYTPFVGLVISSILQNATPANNYDIIVFSNGITQGNQQMLLNTLSSHPNCSIRFVDAQAYITDDLSERNHINRSTYLRFVIAKALKHYPKTVYLDCDLVVNHDIADLYNIDLKDNYLACCRDTIYASWVKHNTFDTHTTATQLLGLSNVYQYFNAGVLVINIPKFNALFPTENLFALARSRKWSWQDQDLLNYLAKGHTLLLNQKWNYLAHNNRNKTDIIELNLPQWLYKEYLSAKEEPYIVHYCGRNLPCFAYDAELQEYFWKYARNSPVYELLLSLQAQEYSNYNAKKSKLSNKIAFVKEGIKYLKEHGWRATVNKYKAIRDAQKTSGMSMQVPVSTSHYSIVKKALKRLIGKLNIICKAHNIDYWLTHQSLYAYMHNKKWLKHGATLQVGMLRKDLAKLIKALQHDNFVELAIKLNENSVSYLLKPKGIDYPHIEVYSYDLCEQEIETAQALSQQLRSQFCESYTAQCDQNTLVQQLLQVPELTDAKTVIVGKENNVFCYACAFEYKDVLPSQKSKLISRQIALPHDIDSVLSTLYLKWDNIKLPPNGILIDNTTKKQLKHFVKYCVK